MDIIFAGIVPLAGVYSSCDRIIFMAASEKYWKQEILYSRGLIGEWMSDDPLGLIGKCIKGVINE